MVSMGFLSLLSSGRSIKLIPDSSQSLTERYSSRGHTTCQKSQRLHFFGSGKLFFAFPKRFSACLRLVNVNDKPFQVPPVQDRQLRSVHIWMVEPSLRVISISKPYSSLGFELVKQLFPEFWIGVVFRCVYSSTNLSTDC